MRVLTRLSFLEKLGVNYSKTGNAGGDGVNSLPLPVAILVNHRNMKKLLLPLILSSLVLFSCQKTNRKDYDIIVYGGTSAGVIAAYSARLEGKNVLLIEPGQHLGGLSSGGLGQTDIGNKYAVTGLARNFYRRLGDHYGKLEVWKFEPHAAEEVFKKYIEEASVDVLYDFRITGVRNGRTD